MCGAIHLEYFSCFCFECIKLETNTNVCERAVNSEVHIDKHHLIAEYAPSLFTVLLLLVYVMLLACQSSVVSFVPC